MKIYPTSLIDLKKAEIGIERMSITYVQPIDEVQDGDPELDVQSITITAEESGACINSKEIESGKYDDAFYLTISTKRWAIDNENDIAELIRDFRQRLQNKQHNGNTDEN